MDGLLAALADPARWRIVTLLAEHPLSVGVIAQRAGLRQPQATKHLQALERAGVVVAYRLGQRRVYALEPGPLRALADRLGGLADAAGESRGDRSVLDQYRASIAAETLAADRAGWADGRVFRFHRRLPAPRDVVWRHWTDASLMATWWRPPRLRVSDAAFDARPGGPVVLEYRDADDAAGTEPVMGRAEGVVDAVDPGRRVAFRLSPVLTTGAVAFTGHYEVALHDDADATRLDLTLGISDSTVESAPMIAGIELGWAQTLDQLTLAVTRTKRHTTSNGARS